MPANPSPAPEVLAKLEEIELQAEEAGDQARQDWEVRADSPAESVLGAALLVYRAALEAALTALAAAQNDLEQERVRLAGCLTAADGWSGELAQDAYGWSPAFQRVREIRQERDEAVAQLAAATREAETLRKAALRLKAYADERAHLSRMTPLHHYVEGIHQGDCGYCALKAALEQK